MAEDRHELDLRGLKCPLPVLRARKALGRLPAGAMLEVIATDPMAAIDIPHMCREDGHAVVRQDPPDGRVLRFVIRRGGASAEPA